MSEYHSWQRIQGPLAIRVLVEAGERGDSGSLELADVHECRYCGKVFRFQHGRSMSPAYLVPRFWCESKPFGSRVVRSPGPCGRRHPSSDLVEPWRPDRPNIFEERRLAVRP